MGLQAANTCTSIVTKKNSPRSAALHTGMSAQVCAIRPVLDTNYGTASTVSGTRPRSCGSNQSRKQCSPRSKDSPFFAADRVVALLRLCDEPSKRARVVFGQVVPCRIACYRHARTTWAPSLDRDYLIAQQMPRGHGDSQADRETGFRAPAMRPSRSAASQPRRRILGAAPAPASRHPVENSASKRGPPFYERICSRVTAPPVAHTGFHAQPCAGIR